MRMEQIRATGAQGVAAVTWATMTDGMRKDARLKMDGEAAAARCAAIHHDAEFCDGQPEVSGRQVACPCPCHASAQGERQE